MYYTADDLELNGEAKCYETVQYGIPIPLLYNNGYSDISWNKIISAK